MNILKFFMYKKAIKQRDENDPAYKRHLAESVSKKLVRYVSERIENSDTGEVVDTILGKDGMFHIDKESCLLVICGGKDIFKAEIASLSMGELMSLEGVILEGYDFVSERQRKIIAYYKYYR